MSLILLPFICRSLIPGCIFSLSNPHCFPPLSAQGSIPPRFCDAWIVETQKKKKHTGERLHQETTTPVQMINLVCANRFNLECITLI